MIRLAALLDVRRFLSALLLCAFALTGILGAQGTDLPGCLSNLSLGANDTMDFIALNASTPDAGAMGGAVGPVYLVRVNGRPFAMLRDDCAPISDEPLVWEYLMRYEGQGKSLDDAQAAAGRMHGQVLALAEVRKNGQEAECGRLTGMDIHPCDSFDTCQYACYSVTSYCYPIALGAGREFVNALWGYANTSRRLDEAVRNESVEYEALADGFEPAALARYGLSEREVNKAAGRMLQSALINWICQEPDFDMAAYSRAEYDLASAQDTLAGYGQTEADARQMALWAAKKTAATALGGNDTGPAPESEAFGNGANGTAGETNETGDAGCSATVVHQIFSGANASYTRVMIRTSNCTLGAFEFADTIPVKFSPDLMEIGWSIEPTNISNNTAFWEFDGLKNEETLTMTYTVPRWVGFSKVDGFDQARITLENKAGAGAVENATVRIDAAPANESSAQSTNRTGIDNGKKQVGMNETAPALAAKPQSGQINQTPVLNPAPPQTQAGTPDLADWGVRAGGIALVLIAAGAAFWMMPKGKKKGLR